MKSELKAKHGWLSEVNSQSLQSALRNLDTAYTNSFRNTKAVAFPRFKSSKNKQSFLFCCRFITRCLGQSVV